MGYHLLYKYVNNKIENLVNARCSHIGCVENCIRLILHINILIFWLEDLYRVGWYPNFYYICKSKIIFYERAINII